MITLLLEIKRNDNVQGGNFYNPSLEKFKAYPRTQNGVIKAIKQFKKILEEYEVVEDYRIATYEGRKDYYNEKPFLGYITKETIINEF